MKHRHPVFEMGTAVQIQTTGERRLSSPPPSRTGARTYVWMNCKR